MKTVEALKRELLVTTLGVTKQELAEAIGEGRSQVSRIIGGSRHGSIETRTKLAEALNKQVTALFVTETETAAQTVGA